MADGLAHEHDEQHRVEEPLGPADEPRQRPPPPGSSPRRAHRLTWLMRVRPISATARKAATEIRTTTTPRARKIVGAERGEDRHRTALAAEARRRGPSQWSSSNNASSRARITGGLVGLRVIVTEHVEQPMHDEQRELIVDRAGVGRARWRPRPRDTPRRHRGGAVRRSDREADDRARRARAARPAGSGASIGNASTSVGPVGVHELLVQLATSHRSRRKQRDLARARAHLRRRSTCLGEPAQRADRRGPRVVRRPRTPPARRHRRHGPDGRVEVVPSFRVRGARTPRRCRRRCDGARHRRPSRCTNARPSMPVSTDSSPTRPLRPPGTSICVCRR